MIIISKGIVILDIPDCCAECYFHSKSEEIGVGSGFYRKISKCLLAPESIEDPWKDIHWQMEHKETWCPFKPLPEPYDLDTPHDRDYDQEFEHGYNQCIKELWEGPPW